MKTENKVLMERARQTLSGKWGLAIGAYVIFVVIVIGLGSIPKVGGLINFLVVGSMSLGISMFFLSFSRQKEAKISQVFDGFNHFGTAFVAYLLTGLFTLLWSLLLIVPGIIAALSYSQTFFILADDPTMRAGEAIKKSKKMMDGYKWKFFCLEFRFFWWGILSILTLGIGLFWLMPYIQVSMAKFYDDIKG